MMELLNEILVGILKREGIHSSLQDLATITTEVLDSECCRALGRIKMILEDKSLTDFDCIEEIVSVFEELGSGCSFRHDY